MPVQKLKEFLDHKGVRYVVMSHSPAFSALEVAEAVHVSGRKLAKTVMLRVDGRNVMAVLPASEKVDLSAFRKLAAGDKLELATEAEFESLFPGCEVGAMPPFGNLWSLPVFVCDSLAKEKDICFAAGNHHEVMKLAFDDFRRLVEPRFGAFGVPRS